MFQTQTAAVDFSTAATQSLVAANGTKRIAVLGYGMFNGVATAQTIQFKSGSNNSSGVLALPSTVGGGQVVISGNEKIALFVTDPGAALTMVMSAATQVGGFVIFQYI